MDGKNIFANIPSGKYHSALMTAYSINLYYWEIQVLKALSAKGIEYVSALVDEECLSEELQHFSMEIGNRKPKQYGLHGFRAKGAFHPKIMFFAGRDCALALVGSGNLTSCGHGRNLEVWTPIAVESKESSAYLLILDIWHYVQQLYMSLGPEAEEIVHTVQTNCSLLQVDHELSGKEFEIDGDRSIRFMSNANAGAILSQLCDWTGDDKISSITVLSPFYDQNARFLTQLEAHYHPSEFNVIVENGGLGNLPLKKAIPESCRIFNWQKCKLEGMAKPHNYHAKCFFLKGAKYNYLLCGSANASIAAMGIGDSILGMNYEACIAIKSAGVDFLSESGITLPEDTFSYEDQKTDKPKEGSIFHQEVWLKEVSVSGAEIKIAYAIETDMVGLTLVLESADHKRRYVSAPIPIACGNGESKVIIPDLGFIPAVSWLADGSGKRVSGIQFVIHSQSMLMASPDKDNASFRKNCRAIEDGKFFNDSMLAFVEEMFGDGMLKHSSRSKKKEEKKEEKPSETRKFSSYEEYMQGNDVTVDNNPALARSYQRSSALLDSILSFAGRSAKEIEDQEIDAEIDNEDDEESKTSGKENKKKDTIPDSKQVTLAKRVGKLYAIFNKYVSELEPETLNVSAASSGSFVMIEELKRFVTVLFLANRLIGFSSRCDNELLRETLRVANPLSFSTRNRNNLTELIYRSIALFGLYVFRHKRIDEPSKFYQRKLELYSSYAFELSLALLSVCDWINKGNPDYSLLRGNYKHTALLNIQWAMNYFSDDDTVFRSMKRIDPDLLRSDTFDRNEIEMSMGESLTSLESVKLEHGCPSLGQFYLDDKLGHVFVGKETKKAGHFVPYTVAAKFDDKSKEFRVYFFKDVKSLIPDICVKVFESNKFNRTMSK